jgi:hypothetical protein
VRALVALLTCLLLTSCGRSYSAEDRPTWRTGYWYWSDRTDPADLPGDPIDSLYVHAGNIHSDQRGWFAYARLPDRLPPAREYWVVFRYDRQSLPDLAAAPLVARETARLIAAARRNGVSIFGLQLDIDSPTSALGQYAAFLREVKKDLPGVPVSITALLDWFRPGTAVADVIRETHEFVPQFYDTADPRRNRYAIAEPVDAARWGPIFNRFRKPFRIGISTFGRARLVRRERSEDITYFGDLVPLHIASDPAFQIRSARNSAGELILTWTAAQSTRVSYIRFAPGDAVEFTLPTAESVHSAVDAARRMGGNLAGVVFFRWSSTSEPVSLQPIEALAAAGLRAADPPRNSLLTIDQACAAVACVDLYFDGARPWSPEPLRSRIVASAPLEYFLPEKGLAVRMTGPSILELSLPPYTARGRILLGRAVSSRPVTFRLEGQP